MIRSAPPASTSCAAALALLAFASGPASGQVAALSPSARCDPARVATIGRATPGSAGFPLLTMAGSPQVGLPFQLEVTNARPSTSGFLVLGTAVQPLVLSALGGTLFPGGTLSVLGFGVDARGRSSPLLRQAPVSVALCGLAFVAQAALLDPQATGGLALTKGLHVRFGAASEHTLFPGAKYPAGPLPSSVALADMDVDGTLDAVVGGSSPAVLLGAGRGGLSPALFTGAGGSGPVSAGDLNDDGVPDLVQWHLGPSPALVVQLGTGGGALGAPLSYPVGGSAPLPPPSPQVSCRPILADLNGDAFVDLAIAVSGCPGTCLEVLFGHGDGTFGPPVPFAAGPSGFERQDLGAGDLDGNGTRDLVVTMQNGLQIRTSVLLNAGDGTFAAPAVHGMLGKLFEPVPLAIGDASSDGIPDLVVGDQLLIGDGAGGVASVLPLPLTSRDVELADMDADGVLDLVALAERDRDVHVLLGAGDGTFRPHGSALVGADPSALAVGDLDGDAHPDALVANLRSRDVSVLLNPGDGALPSGTRLRAGGPQPQHLAVGDVDGDQLPDLVAISPDLTAGDTLSFVSVKADGSFADPVLIGFSGRFTTGLAIGDLDGDLVPDLVVATRPSGLVQPPDHIAVLKGQGAGAFAAQVDHPAPSVGAVALHDLDLDGDLDVAATARDVLLVLLGAGDGTLAPARSQAAGDASLLLNLTSLAIADLDLDGFADVAAGSQSLNLPRARISVLLGTGSGTFPTYSELEASSPMSATVDVAIADGNGDGAPDLFAAVVLGSVATGDGAAAVLTGRGDGTFDPWVAFPAGRGSASVAVGDVDGDQRLDIALRSSWSADFSILLGNPSGSFALPLAYPAGGRGSLALEDLNGDQVLDLATAAYTNSNQSDPLLVLFNGRLR